ncbi:MAG: prepilin-type N-terminal cleavage/methylation domain-containing protein [Sphingobacteriia bacterium]|nr:prepilin-type N-terminal cleavage/methylation domain-containing protein [Sphingobacteriia bacterium]
MAKKTGFTILEMSVVILIIAVIASGITAGNQLVRSAKITKIMSDIERFKNAVNTFETKYKNIPGDISDSSTSVTAGGQGNANGIIDGNEDVLFWRHLSNANLILGNFSGSALDRYKATSGSMIGGVPAGPIEGSGFRVLNDPNGLLISFDGYSNTNNDLAILTPSEANQIDLKYDDGLPNVGKIRGYDGSNVALNSCVLASGQYNSANTNLACRMAFFIELKSNISGTKQTCTGGYPLGSVRQSSTQACSAGTIGKIIEECVQTSGGAAWVVTKNSCEAVKCGFGVSSGSSINWPCPFGWSGNVVLTCQTSGYFSINTSGCSIDTTAQCRIPHSNDSANVVTRNLSCPVGQSGYVIQQCPNTGANPKQWTTVTNACSALPNCTGAISIGSMAAGGSNNCVNGNYTMVAAGVIRNTCQLTTPGNNPGGTSTYVTFGPQQNSYCLPIYTGAACTPGVTRDIGCPTGYTGSHIQVCVSTGNYLTTRDECKPITCGGEPVGAFRLSKNITCNQNETGEVYEVCHSDGTWRLHFNCSRRACMSNTGSGTEVPSQNTGWGNYNQAQGTYLAHSNSTLAQVTCATAPYTNTSNNNTSATRRCGFDGTWQARNGACAAGNCAQLNWNNTTDVTETNLTYYSRWPQTVAPEHGEYTILTMTAPASTVVAGSPYCDQTDVSGSGFTRELITSSTANPGGGNNANLICNARGIWVDMCSTAGIITTTDNNRIAAVNALTSNYTNPSNGLVMSNNSAYLHFYNDLDNNKICDISGASPSEVSPAENGGPGNRCSACNSEFICFH